MSARITAYIRQHHLALVALFFALTGTAYAVDGPLPGQNQVGSEDIINQEVKTDDIQDAGIRTADLRNDVVTTAKIADGAVQSNDVADGALTGTDVADGTLDGLDVADSSLGGEDVVDSSLTGADVVDSSLTGADVQNSSLTGSDIATGSLTGSDIATGSLTGSDIANTNSIGGAEIDESDLELPFTAVGDFQQSDECSGVLSKSPEVCARVDITLLPPFSRVFAVASGGWRKELGDPADSQCSLFVGGEFQDILFMGDKTGFGGGHSSSVHGMPFTLNATTDRLDGGIKAVELICEDNSSDDQDTFIDDVSISALAAG